MVRFITVEREYGTLGAEFAHQLADRLGWKLLDEALIDEVAALAGVPIDLARSRDEAVDPWFHRIGKAFWHGSLDRISAGSDAVVFDGERMVGLVNEVMTKNAAEGNCVIVGRGASSVLGGVKGAFHVFVYAAMIRKIRWFEQSFPDKARWAEQEILATDRRRGEFVRRNYDHTWNDYRLYHLLLNSCMGQEAMIEATLAAAGRK